MFVPHAVAFAAAANSERRNVNKQPQRIGDFRHGFGVGKKSIVGFGEIIINEGFLPGAVCRIGIHRKHDLNGGEAVHFAGHKILAGSGQRKPGKKLPARIGLVKKRLPGLCYKIAAIGADFEWNRGCGSGKSSWQASQQSRKGNSRFIEKMGSEKWVSAIESRVWRVFPYVRDNRLFVSEEGRTFALLFGRKPRYDKITNELP